MTTKNIAKSVALIVNIIIMWGIVQLVEGNGGRTDSSGGHYNRKTGAYHYHSGGGKRKSNISPKTNRAIKRKSNKAMSSKNIDKGSAESSSESSSLKPEATQSLAGVLDRKALEYPRFKMIPANNYIVDSIVDGDTIKVRRNTEPVLIVRLIGVDTPETKHPTKPIQDYGNCLLYTSPSPRD